MSAFKRSKRSTHRQTGHAWTGARPKTLCLHSPAPIYDY